MLKHQELIDKMSLNEKIRITSGKDNWRTEEYPSLGIPKITLSDGPHGLRHQEEEQDHLGINESNPATCFPPACLSAASFDEELLYEMGRAIGIEAINDHVHVVLGPGVNIKRNPLCGRNFEYFSEDPYLSARLSSAWIKGLQSTGVGASLKHFALNNQEKNRMKSDSIADRKAMHDIYLKAFEKPVREAKPYTVMCSYNLVDGVYASENTMLLKEVLREKFGFEGAIVTDWAAMNDKTASLKAGLDLEMPGGAGYFDEKLEEDIGEGKLDEGTLDQAVDRILELILKTAGNEKIEELTGTLDIEKHHELAKRIALESVILLKNEDKILPVSRNENRKIVVVGALAEKPRYQGAGSSHIIPYKLTSLLDALNDRGIAYTFYEGYSLLKGQSDDDILKGIGKNDTVIIAAGLPDSYESEGFDREHMRLPDEQNELIEKIAEVNRNTAVLLYGGAPVEMPWIEKIRGLINLYLPGQAGGEVAAEILFGETNPSGKLPETYPLLYSDHVTSEIYGRENYEVGYREGIYVGYRYFDKAQKEVLFPFGFGLSYTDFAYDALSLSHERIDFDETDELKLTFRIRNTGKLSGKETAQLYVRRTDHEGYMAEKELKGFRKVSLEAGEEKEVTLNLRKEDLLQFDLTAGKEMVYEGDYDILIGSSSRDILLKKKVYIAGEPYIKNSVPDFYKHPSGKPSLSDFEDLLGRKLPERSMEKPFTVNSTLSEMSGVPQMKIVIRKLSSMLMASAGVKSRQDNAYKVVHSMFMQTPVKRLTLVSPDKMPKYMGEVLVLIANGEFLKAAAKTRAKK